MGGEAMIHLILAVLVQLTGHEDFFVREHAERALTHFVARTWHATPVQHGLTHRDPEVRFRCRRVLRRCVVFRTDPGLALCHFNFRTDEELWLRANHLPSGVDARWFVRTLLEEKRTHPWAVAWAVARAEAYRRADRTPPLPWHRIQRPRP